VILLKKEFKVPLAILAALLIAYFLRWNYHATKSYDYYVVKWKTDRWTGVNWTEQYTAYGVEEFPSNYSSMSKLQIQNKGVEKDLLTLAWYLLTGLTLVWMLKTNWQIKRREQKPPPPS
jgi:hypothetical protein